MNSKINSGKIAMGGCNYGMGHGHMNRGTDGKSTSPWKNGKLTGMVGGHVGGC